MAVQLFEHNAKAYQAAVKMMQQYGKAAIVHPTGTGKSYIAFKLIEDHPDAVIVWLSPSEYIFKTQRESLLRQDPDFPLQNVRFYTYAKLICCTPAQLQEIAAQDPAYILLDEFHRVGAEYWGDSTQKLLALCPQAKLLGLTATNVRYLDNNRDMAEELFDGHVASEMSLGEAIVRGILPTPKYVTTVFKYQQDLARYQNRVNNLRSPGIQDVNQKYLDALKRALEQAEGLDKVFARHITNKSGKYIVFCSGKEHMDEMISHVPQWFAAIDPAPTVYRALSEDPSVAVYRFVNLMGHSRPKYNSAVSTFCWAVANDEPFTVNDRSTELELLYIDDLVEGMFDLLEGKEQHCEFDGVETVLKADGRYCCVPVTHKVTLGEIVDLLQEFKAQPTTLMMPKMPDGSFAKKLYSLYLTYLPTDKFKYALKMNVDNRGSFTELVHTADCGQVSINISRPGITKGQHWHNSKWELFIVVAGHGLIQERNINTGETVEFEVSGDKIEAVHMIPGWTHNIINLSETENLVTVMTCNEIFNPNHPDTFFEPV